MSVSIDLAVLSDLRKRGELTAAEYAAVKQHVLTHGSLEIADETKTPSADKRTATRGKQMPQWRRRLNQYGLYVVVAFWVPAGIMISYGISNENVGTAKASAQQVAPASFYGPGISFREGVACRTAPDFKRFITLAAQEIAQGPEAVPGCRPYGKGIRADVVSINSWSGTTTFELRDSAGRVTQYVTGSDAFVPAGDFRKKLATYYNKADYRNAWPYPPFADATVNCKYENGRPMVTVTLGTTDYGLNGPARGAGGYADPRGLVPRDQYGAFDSTALSTVDTMLKAGLNAC